MKTRLAAICLSMIVLAQAPLALAQNAQLSSDQAWDLVKQTTLGEKLELKLKDGRKVKGEMILASDTGLSLSVKNQQAVNFNRGDVRQVWRALHPGSDKQKFYQGVGGGVGALAGIAIAIAATRPDEPCGDCRGRGIGMAAAIIGMTTAGALIGRKLGGGAKRILIYQAP